MSNSLAAGRRALWDAVNHWPPLQGKFKSKFCYERVSAGKGIHPQPWQKAPSSFMECPAIAMFGTDIPFEWITNKTADIEYTISVGIWTPELYQDVIEELWQEVCRAAFQSHAPDDPNVTFIRRATGRLPKIQKATISDALFTKAAAPTLPDTQARCLQLTGGITLVLKSSPTVD